MIGLFLATLLNLSPGIQLADNVAARNVALSGTRFPLLFVAAGDDRPRPSIDAMTREQLAVELRRLDNTVPSLVGPIVLLSVGGVLCVPGAALMIYGITTAGEASSVAILGYFVATLGVAVLTVGVVLALIGGIKLATRSGSRRKHAEDTNEVRMKIDEMDQIVPPPPGPDMMPPPPPPPPHANLVNPATMQTVMTF